MKILIFISTLVALMSYENVALSAEIRIDGDRIIVISDDGKMIDTANLPPSDVIHNGNDVHVDEGGVKIGTSNAGDSNKNRTTNLDNVVIINNGKTTIYKNTDKK